MLLSRIRISSTQFRRTRHLMCNKCGKVEHFMKVCKSDKANISAISQPLIRAFYPTDLSNAILQITMQNQNLCALIDSGSTDNYVSEASIQVLGLSISLSYHKVSTAQTNFTCNVIGTCKTDIQVNRQSYRNITLGVSDGGRISKVGGPNAMTTFPSPTTHI